MIESLFQDATGRLMQRRCAVKRLHLFRVIHHLLLLCLLLHGKTAPTDRQKSPLDASSNVVAGKVIQSSGVELTSDSTGNNEQLDQGQNNDTDTVNSGQKNKTNINTRNATLIDSGKIETGENLDPDHASIVVDESNIKEITLKQIDTTTTDVKNESLENKHELDTKTNKEIISGETGSKLNSKHLNITEMDNKNATEKQNNAKDKSNKIKENVDSTEKIHNNTRKTGDGQDNIVTSNITDISLKQSENTHLKQTTNTVDDGNSQSPKLDKESSFEKTKNDTNVKEKESNEKEKSDRVKNSSDTMKEEKQLHANTRKTGDIKHKINSSVSEVKGDKENHFQGDLNNNRDIVRDRTENITDVDDSKHKNITNADDKIPKNLNKVKTGEENSINITITAGI